MKAVRFSSYDNKSSTILHCSGAEETLISCFSPDTSMSTCYYLLVGCRDLPDSTEHIITQTPVIITTNIPLPTEILSGTESTEDDGITTAVVAGVLIIGAMVVVIILLVVVLIVVLSKKNKKSAVNSRCKLFNLVFGIVSFMQYFRNTEQDLNMEANPVYSMHIHNPVRADIR